MWEGASVGPGFALSDSKVGSAGETGVRSGLEVVLKRRALTIGYLQNLCPGGEKTKAPLGKAVIRTQEPLTGTLQLRCGLALDVFMTTGNIWAGLSGLIFTFSSPTS